MIPAFGGLDLGVLYLEEAEAIECRSWIFIASGCRVIIQCQVAGKSLIL